MSSVSPSEIKKEFLKSKMGIAGIGILVILVAISIGAIIIIPVETFQQWNNPQSWIFYPKTAIPIWVNWFMFEKIPEHKILDAPSVSTKSQDEISVVSHQFHVNYVYDDFPSDFIYEFTAKYSGSPLLQISVIRPDGSIIKLLAISLPYTDDIILHNEKIFSTDGTIRKNLFLQSDKFDFLIEGFPAEDIVFSKSTENVVLKGDYVFLVNLYGVQKENSIVDSTLIVGGKAFGIMGTDELRRDLAVGILWGTPLSLFIGIAVAIGSVVMGLVYGVYAGFKGKLTDESMMRFNDVIYALPVLPFLIILAVTVSNSIFLMIGFLTIFGWVGIAKVSRSM
ncbi:MAG: ABC transporter permease, partial [Nitrosopumilaceae archaeon]